MNINHCQQISTNIFKYVWSLRREFTKYVAVGVASVVLDIGSLILLKRVIRVPPVLAVVINQPAILSFNFFFNKLWSFRNRSLPHRQMVRYVTLAAANYAFSVAAMYILHERLGAGYVTARLATIAAMVAWNFLAYKYWVYTSPLDKNEGGAVH